MSALTSPEAPIPEGNEDLSDGYLLAGRFELLRLLHTGIGSAVFLASDHRDRAALRSLKVFVALKVIDRMPGSPAAEREGVRRDFSVCVKLVHPNLIRLFECTEGPDFQALSMEYVCGVNLAKQVEYGRLRPDQALSIGAQIASAMAELESNGMLHGRLTPEKVLLGADATVKINPLVLNHSLVGAGGDVQAIGKILHLMVYGFEQGAARSRLNRFCDSCRILAGQLMPRRFPPISTPFAELISRASSTSARSHKTVGELWRELEVLIRARQGHPTLPYRPEFHVSASSRRPENIVSISAGSTFIAGFTLYLIIVLFLMRQAAVLFR